MNGTIRSLRASLSEETTVRITAIRDGYRRSWMAGSNPRIEEYLEAEREPERSALLYELLIVDRDCREGTDDRLTLAEAQRRFPQHSEVIDAVFVPAAAAAR